MSSRDIIIFFSLAFFWAMSFIFYRVGVPEFGSLAFSGLRIVFAGLTMVLFVCFKPHYWREAIAHWRLLVFLGLISTAVPFTLFAIAAKDVNAGVLSVTNASVPMLSGVIASVFFSERLSKKQVAGLFVGIAGVAILMSEQLFYTPLQSTIFPLCLALFACIGYATGANLTRHYLHDASSIAITAGSLISAALVMTPIVLINFPYGVAISLKSWFSVICIGVVSTALALILINQLIKNIGPVRATCITLVIPVFAIFLGYILLDEALDLMAIVGSTVILLGTYLSLNISIKQLMRTDKQNARNRH